MSEGKDQMHEDIFYQSVMYSNRKWGGEINQEVHPYDTGIYESLVKKVANEEVIELSEEQLLYITLASLRFIQETNLKEFQRVIRLQDEFNPPRVSRRLDSFESIEKKTGQSIWMEKSTDYQRKKYISLQVNLNLSFFFHEISGGPKPATFTFDNSSLCDEAYQSIQYLISDVDAFSDPTKLLSDIKTICSSCSRRFGYIASNEPTGVISHASLLKAFQGKVFEYNESIMARNTDKDYEIDKKRIVDEFWYILTGLYPQT